VVLLGSLGSTASVVGWPLDIFAKKETSQVADQIFISKTIHNLDGKNAVVEAIAVRQP